LGVDFARHRYSISSAKIVFFGQKSNPILNLIVYICLV
jgi:hypothetical protein